MTTTLALALPPNTVPATGASQSPVAEMLSGKIQHIIFHNPESGFSVLRLSRAKNLPEATVVGLLMKPAQGQTIEAHGEWVNDPKRGPQFKATIINTHRPTTPEAILAYLSSGIIASVGPSTAKAMLAHFGPQLLDLMDKEPERIREIRGIGDKRANKIISSWQEHHALRQIMMFLQEHGLGNAMAWKILRSLGPTAVHQITVNPYCLVQRVSGIGFITADTLAQRLGIAPESEFRIQAALTDVLRTAERSGHTAVPQDKLVEDATTLIRVERALIIKVLEDSFITGRVVGDMISGRVCGFQPRLHAAEKAIAQYLLTRAQMAPPWSVIELQRRVLAIAADRGIPLIESQKRALITLAGANVAILCGGPGVGKTTSTDVIVAALRALGLRVMLMSPTGRAAKRLSEATGEFATTMHRALGLRRPDDNSSDEHEPIEADVVLIDEASMIDVSLMLATLKRIPPTAALILVGDPDQLPSVGPGNVLNDMIRSGRFATARLTEIHRQAANSNIVRTAHRIINGQGIDYGTTGVDSDLIFIDAGTPEAIAAKVARLVHERIPARFGFDPMKQIQVISPGKCGPAGTFELNRQLQALLNPHRNNVIVRGDRSFAAGDKVRQTRNNYELDVFNGDIAMVVDIDQDEDELLVDFDGRTTHYPAAAMHDLQLAYCTTVHGFQGSESPAVVIPLTTQFYPLLNRNLLFTAVTRARKLCVIVGQRRAANIAVRTAGSIARLTRLTEHLADAA